MMPETVLKGDQTILETREITLRFGGLEALNGLSFSISPHQIVSIIGPNGAGKTTLLNAITGVYSADSGEILFRGSPISRLKSFQIAALGINRTFQQAQLFVNMTVLENVMVGMHGQTKSGFLGGAFISRARGERRRRSGKRPKASSIFSASCPKPVIWLRTSPWPNKNAWRFPGLWPAIPNSSCWMSRWPG